MLFRFLFQLHLFNLRFQRIPVTFGCFQRHNDGVAAVSSAGGPLVSEAPRDRKGHFESEEPPTSESDGGPGWLRYTRLYIL